MSKSIKMTQIFGYLRELGLADQIHIRDDEEFVFYHWNQNISNLIVSLVIKHGLIEEVKYPRSKIPRIFNNMNVHIEDNLDLEKHKFVRDKRAKTDN